MICNFATNNMRSRTICLFFVVSLFLSVQAFRFSKDFYPWTPTNGCSNFDGENGCRGSQTQNDDSWVKRGFQTPPRGDNYWQQSWQDYNILVGYPQVIYSSDKRSANIDVKTRVNPKFSGAELKYSFNGTSKSSSTLSVSAPAGVLSITVQAWQNGNKIASLEL